MIEPGAQSARGHERLDLVVQQQGFKMPPVGIGVLEALRFHIAVVRASWYAISVEPARHLPGVALVRV
jgi:hypothetical protein